jgi:hypothetical protein
MVRCKWVQATPDGASYQAQDELATEAIRRWTIKPSALACDGDVTGPTPSGDEPKKKTRRMAVAGQGAPEKDRSQTPVQVPGNSFLRVPEK